MGKTGFPEAEAFLFAHMSGDGDLVYVSGADGATEHFLTGGADCVAHLRSPTTLAAAGEAAGVGHHDAGVTALAASRRGDRFATACEDGQVRLFAYPDGELQAIATRFTLPVRALAFSADGTLLAAGGDEDAIRLLDVSGDEPAVRHTLQGTFRAVRSVSFDPTARARRVAASPAPFSHFGRFGRQLRRAARAAPRARHSPPLRAMCPCQPAGAGGAACVVPRGRHGAALGRRHRRCAP